MMVKQKTPARSIPGNANDFSQGRLPGQGLGDAVLSQSGHALFDGKLLHVLCGGRLHDELAQGRCNGGNLKNAGATSESTLPAGGASLAPGQFRGPGG